MEGSRYNTDRSKPQGRSYFGLTSLLGGTIGAGGGFGSGMLYGAAKDMILTQLPNIAKGKDVVTALTDSVLHGYSFAGDAAIIGGILGLMLAVKFRDAVSYVLRGK